jgi:hypothetical protein
MKLDVFMAASALAICALVNAAPERASAQVDGLGSCQRGFDANAGTPTPSIGSCSVTGVVLLGEGQQTFFDIVGTARAFEAGGDNLYDVQLTVSASGDYPEGFRFGQAEVRSTNGDVCQLEVSSGFGATTCEGMFSGDGGFTVFVEAFTGAVPD